MATPYPWQHESWQRWNGLRIRLPHAILLKGPQGTGKLDFALNMAQSLLCEQPAADGLACGECPSCRWFLQETHPDFRLLQPQALAESDDGEAREGGKKRPSRQITVDQVRALGDFANLSAHQGGHRVVLIHPAEAMNTAAANALLKTLEEPTSRMILILVSHKPQQLLPTIRSRCVALALPMPSPDTSRAWLEQAGVADPAVVLARAGFAPLAAVRMAEAGGEPEEYARLLQDIRQPARLDALALAEQLQKSEPAQVIHWLQQWCYDLASAKLAGTVRYHPAQAKAVEELAGRIPVLALARYQKELAAARREALHPLNPRLLFESLFLSYQQMALESVP
ncbi:MAG TPA: DNA polymerase III subunit delta' [Gallionellaceae bacterium]|nr:DNA polymerase III subunit delta' [Gallionellaceae bacterium]